MLSRITTKRQKREFLVYDMEWYPGVGQKAEKLRLVGVYDGTKYRTFTDVNAFLDAVCTRENRDKWFYAHYGGMADSQFLLHAICQRKDEWSVSASFSGSSAIIITIRKRSSGYEYNFVDSFWLLRDRLAKIGEQVGLPKLGDDYKCDRKRGDPVDFPACGHIDHLEDRWLDPGEEPHSMCVFYAKMEDLKVYNERDCVILYRAIKDFEEVLLDAGGQLQMTIASCAMHLFRRKYLGDDIRTNAAVNAWARKAYTSSRVEPFQRECPSPAFLRRLDDRGIRPCDIGRNQIAAMRAAEERGDEHGADVWSCNCDRCAVYRAASLVKYMDLNSSFPYAMTFDCPGNVKRLLDGKLPKWGALYIADVEVSVPSSYLPPLPYRHKGRVFFPTGRWRSWFSNVDLELLERRGGKIEKVYSSVEFYPQNYLRNYAIDIYDRRKNAKTSFEKLVFKYLLNSLYGKFGESTEKSSLLLFPDSTHCPHTPKHRCDHWPRCEHAMAGVECNLCLTLLRPGMFILTEDVALSHEWVPIAQKITAEARKNLEGYLYMAQDDLYYCDTDSALTTVEGIPTNDTELGALKLEKYVDHGQFVACKIYSTHTPEKVGKDGKIIPAYFDVKAKGFSRMSYKKFQAMRAGEEIQISRMTRTKELFRRGKTDPEENIVGKKLVQRVMPKRRWIEEGQSTPWSIEEIQHWDEKSMSVTDVEELAYKE